jgi:exosome complex component RRP40
MLVLPGQVVLSVDALPAQITLGPGLIQTQDGLVSVYAGILHTNKTGEYWVDSNRKRHVPALGEPVIGIITAKTSDYYKVDIGTAMEAHLSTLAFEGATKRNKPNLSIGALVYGRLTLANRDMEPEMECVHGVTAKADGFGELKEGFMVTCSIGLCRRLLDPKDAILRVIGDVVAYEVAVGMNGRVWVNSATSTTTIGIVRVIKDSETVWDEKAVKKMAKKVLKS